jgi:hypothetical protein
MENNQKRVKYSLIYADTVAIIFVSFCVYNSIGSEYFALFGFLGKTITIGITSLIIVSMSFFIYRLRFKGATNLNK